MARHRLSVHPLRVLAVLSCAATLLLAGCAGGISARVADDAACAPSNGKITLTYWTWVPNLDKVAEVWNKSHPDIHVQMVPIVNGTDGGYQSMLNAVAAGTSPDLGQVELDQLPLFRILQALKDIENCPGVAEAKPKFPAWLWSQVRPGGEGVYGIPQDTGPMVMLYRKDILGKYGIPVPKTWDEFAAAAATLHAKDPSIYLGNMRDLQSWFAAMAWQAGARWFQQDGHQWKVSIDDPATLKVADYWEKLYRSGEVSDVQQNGAREYAALDSGKIATVMAAAWDLKLLQTAAPDTAGKWAVGPLPQWDPSKPTSANRGGSTTAVLAGSKHPAEAAQFALWLDTNLEAQAMMAKLAGLFPATTEGQQDLPEDPAMIEYFGGPVNQLLRAASDQVDPDFQWGPMMNLTFPHQKDELQAALNNGTPLRAALIRANALTVHELVRQSQPVAGQ